MSVVDTRSLTVIERLPGWYGRYFHSQTMTFAYYDFKRGSSIHEHSHPEEEVWQVLEGKLEMTLGGEKRVLSAGMAEIVPRNAPHSVRALTDGRAIVVDHPARPEFGRE